MHLSGRPSEPGDVLRGARRGDDGRDHRETRNEEVEVGRGGNCFLPPRFPVRDSG